MGANYFRYDGIKNNCQEYIESVLKTNKMGRKDTTNFIKQDVSELVSEALHKGLNFITRIAGIAKTVTD
jgi:hypothetical protein